LLREPLKIEQTKPRLLGHWGSDAGQSFTHMPANMRNGFAAIIAILALIFAFAYQRSQQVVVVHAATRQSHE
jgi:phosphoketolase